MTPFPWHREALAAITSNRERLAHALLVHGAAGIGKVEFARALAAAVLCETPRGGLACEACPSCHWFSQGNHPDYREVIPEAAQEGEEDEETPAKAERAKSVVIKIDQIRALGDFMSLTTHRSGHRVLVIHPAEAMAPGAANALLKTLEEPAAGTLIVLVSDRPARLLPTIRSRCRLVTLHAPAAPQAVAWLKDQGVENAAASLAAAGGAPLLARELAAPEEVEFRRRLLAELMRAGGAEPLTFAERFERGAVERFVHWMQTWVSDLIGWRLAGRARYHSEHSQALAAKARAANLDLLFDLERELATARELAAHPLNPRLLAEHLLMAYNRATITAPP